MGIVGGGFGSSHSSSLLSVNLILIWVDATPVSVPASTMAQPIPVDINGDMKIDLLGMTPQSISAGNPLKVWRNKWNGSESAGFDVCVSLIASCGGIWF